MNWSDILELYRERYARGGYTLDEFPQAWQRELAALQVIESQVFNGGLLQFFVNCDGRYAEAALAGFRRMGAMRRVEIVETCRAIIGEHWSDADGRDRRELMPNPILSQTGELLKPVGSVLPDTVLDRIRELTAAFGDDPDDCETLGARCYGPLVVTESA